MRAVLETRVNEKGNVILNKRKSFNYPYNEYYVVQLENGRYTELSVDAVKAFLKDKRNEHYMPVTVMGHGPYELELINAQLTSDGKILYKKIENSITYTDETIKNMVRMIQEDKNLSLKDISPEFRDNPDVVMAALKKEASIIPCPQPCTNYYQYVSVMHCRSEGCFIGSKLSDNKNFMLKAIQICPRSYGNVSDRLKNDKDICLVAVSTFSQMIDKIPVEYRQNKSFLLNALSSICASKIPGEFNVLLREIPAQVFEDKDFTMQVMKMVCSSKMLTIDAIAKMSNNDGLRQYQISF